MKESILLNQLNLELLGQHVSIPKYNRSELKKRIVHIGVGGFHRAHLAFYLHSLLENENDAEWGICGVGIREADRKMHEVLKNQDGLYTLLVRHPDGKMDTQLIGSITESLLGVDNPKSVIDCMADSKTKIVSLTITEGGYNFNPATGEFDFDNPDIRHDLEHPENPKMIYGYLTAALKKRCDSAAKPFTVMSCDNIQHNGEVARKMLLAYVKKQDAALAKWIETEVSFPNSMVDRITPVTSQADIDYLSNTYGIKEEWPVTCEPFIQWVVEDNFSDGRPEFEKVGVQFVSDVKPYEKMKLRLLNAGHSVLGILGAIHGYPTINACIEDELFRTYLRTFLDTESSPILGDIKGIDLEQYKDSLQERFANPNIKDSVSRICSESAAKLPKFLIATLHENLAADGNIKLATLLIAAWCYYSDKRIDNNGQPIEIIDTMSEELHQAAKQTSIDVLAFIKQESIFGELWKNQRFTKLYTEMVRKIYSDANIKKHMRAIL